MISPSTNTETLNMSVDPATDENNDDDVSLDGGAEGLPGKLSPTTTAVSFSASTSNASAHNKRSSQREEAMMAASQILDKLDFLPDQTDDDNEDDPTETEGEEEENEEFVDPATVKARAEAEAVLEALEFLPEEGDTQRGGEEAGSEQQQNAGEEAVENTTNSPKQQQQQQQRLVREDSINMGAGNSLLPEGLEPERTQTRALSSLADLDNNKPKYLRIVNRNISTSEKVAKDPTAGAKTAEEALFAWRRDMQVTLENFDAKSRVPSDPRDGTLDMSVSNFGVRKDLAWDQMSWLDEGNTTTNSSSSSKRQPSDGIRPHRAALHKQRIYLEGEEPDQEFDFCDWLERSFTPPEKQTIEKMGYCRKQREDCIIM